MGPRTCSHCNPAISILTQRHLCFSSDALSRTPLTAIGLLGRLCFGHAAAPSILALFNDVGGKGLAAWARSAIAAGT